MNLGNGDTGAKPTGGTTRAATGPGRRESTESPFAAKRQELNAYGLPITPPEYFDDLHIANPMSAGMPPCCSCGWTPEGTFKGRNFALQPGGFTMADHLGDMGEFAAA